MSSHIYIIVPVHNRREVTRRFVHCLAQQSVSDYTLMLVDDGSWDGTANMVREYISSLVIIRGEGSWWWGGSLQQGYERLKQMHPDPGDVVLIVNDDTEFEAEFLEQGRRLLQRNRGALLLARCYSKQSGLLLDAGVAIDWRELVFRQADTVAQINCLSTRGLFMGADDFLALGGFRPRLLPHYASDYEFTIRALRKGMKLLTDESLTLCVDELESGYHQFGTMTAWEFLLKFFSKKSSRNPITLTIFVALCCPWRWKVINFLRIWRLAAEEIGARAFLKRLT